MPLIAGVEPTKVSPGDWKLCCSHIRPRTSTNLLCLPANSEQQKIVEILFDCDAAISACDEKLACCKDNVTKLVRYIFDERNEFLDGWCPVSEVCDIAIGGTPSDKIWTIGRAMMLMVTRGLLSQTSIKRRFSQPKNTLLKLALRTLTSN